MKYYDYAEEVAKKQGWKVVKHDDTYCVIHYVKDGIRLLYWYRKGTWGIVPQGKKQHFIRHFDREPDVDYIFTKPMEAWKYLGYRRRTQENRNRFIGVNEVTGNIEGFSFSPQQVLKGI